MLPAFSLIWLFLQSVKNHWGIIVLQLYVKDSESELPFLDRAISYNMPLPSLSLRVIRREEKRKKKNLLSVKIMAMNGPLFATTIYGIDMRLVCKWAFWTVLLPFSSHIFIFSRTNLRAILRPYYLAPRHKQRRWKQFDLDRRSFILHLSVCLSMSPSTAGPLRSWNDLLTYASMQITQPSSGIDFYQFVFKIYIFCSSAPFYNEAVYTEVIWLFTVINHGTLRCFLDCTNSEVLLLVSCIHLWLWATTSLSYSCILY